MNSSTFKGFSALSVPQYRGEPISTLAANRWGDVFTLSENGLSYASLLQKSSACRTLPLSGQDLMLLSQMTCMKFNNFGTMLLVWGPNAAGVIVLPRTYTLYGEFEEETAAKKQTCEFITITRPEECKGRLVKVQWHPYHAEHVVILHQKGPIEMRNVFTGETTSASLSQSIQYSSFSFGPSIGWMAVSVLVLGENGSVNVVCPFLPIGSLLPIEVVVQMADGLAYENDVMERAGGERAKLLKQANLYMSAAFGDLSGEYRAQGDMACVGGPLVSLVKETASATVPSDLPYHQRLLLEVLKCPPALQGTMREISDLNGGTTDSSKRQNTGARGQDVSRAHEDSGGSANHKGLRKRESGVGTTAVTACDLAVLPAAPGERGSENDWAGADCAPVVVVGRADGTAKICVIKGQVCPHWDDIASSQKFLLLQEATGGHGAGIAENALLRPLPDLVTVELLQCPLKSAGDSQLWSLRADPVLRHCFHMIAHGSGAAFLVSVRWLADALFAMQQASSNATAGASRTRADGDVGLLSNGDSSIEISPATVIPVFPTATVSASAARGHPITAFLVIHDPTYGHIALYQTCSPSGSSSPTAISSVNLTVLLAGIAQEQRLLNKMQRTVYTGGEVVATPMADNLSIDRDDALHRSASRILRQAEQALQDCRLQVTQHEADREAEVNPPSVDLSATWTQLDNEVVAPLEELQQRISLSVDIVRDVYEAQVEMLSGPKAAPSGGLIKQLENIRAKQAAIDERMKKIAADLEEQVGVCAAIMAFSSFKARELTTGEREYKAELARCENIVSRLDAAIQSLDSIQVQRMRVSREPRNILTPPSGMKNRLEQGSQPGSPALSPKSGAGVRSQGDDEETAEMQSAFMSLGLKSSKKTSAEKRHSDSGVKGTDQTDSHHAPKDNEPPNNFSVGENGGFQQHNAEFNVYSSHTPFVTPLRAKNGEPGSTGKMSFSSPVAPMSASRSGHWTVHNFTSTTPHKSASKWSVNRPHVASSRVGSNPLFRASHKRRPDAGSEQKAEEPARKHTENVGNVASLMTPSKNNTDVLIDKELLEKLGREGSDIEYLCKEIADVEKRIVELTNATLTMPSGGLRRESGML